MKTHFFLPPFASAPPAAPPAAPFPAAALSPAFPAAAGLSSSSSSFLMAGFLAIY